MNRLLRKSLLIVGVIVIFSQNAYANIGVPMLAVAWPVMWLTLLPVILIEWRVLKKDLLNFSQNQLLSTVAISNVVSTLVGIPLAWAFMFGLELLTTQGTFPPFSLILNLLIGITLQSAWLLPYGEALSWMVPAAFIVLLIPFFLISYWIEAFVSIKWLQKYNLKIKKDAIKNAVWKANKRSYLILFLLGLLYLGINFIKMYHQSPHLFTQEALMQLFN